MDEANVAMTALENVSVLCINSAVIQLESWSVAEMMAAGAQPRANCAAKQLHAEARTPPN